MEPSPTGRLTQMLREKPFKKLTWRKKSGSLQHVGFVLFKANEAYKLRENGMKVVRQIVDERIMKVIKDSGMDEAMTKVESVGTHQVDPAC